MESIADIVESVVNGTAMVTVKCSVKTCLPDMEVQFFRGSELMDSSTSMVDSGWEGVVLITVSNGSDEKYACQAMNDYYNILERKFFSVTGKYTIDKDIINMHAYYTTSIS